MHFIIYKILLEHIDNMKNKMRCYCYCYRVVHSTIYSSFIKWYVIVTFFLIFFFIFFSSLNHNLSTDCVWVSMYWRDGQYSLANNGKWNRNWRQNCDTIFTTTALACMWWQRQIEHYTSIHSNKHDEWEQVGHLCKFNVNDVLHIKFK